MEINRMALRMGILASIAIIALVLAFILAVMLFPLPENSTADQVIGGYNRTHLLPVIPSFLLVLANIPYFISLYYIAADEKKPLAMAGVFLGVCYVVCSGGNYFLQLTAIPHNIQLGHGYSIALLHMSVKGSVGYALDALGYMFLALSFMVFSGIFDLKGFPGFLKAVFWVYGISGVLGTLGYMTRLSLLETLVFISAFPYLLAVILTLMYYLRMRPSVTP